MSSAERVEQKEIKAIITEALAELYARNLQILQLDVAERTICAQLASILQRSFDEHAVHTEYNRHGVEPKDIELPNADGVLTRNLVYPDIIVHQPGHDHENILVIEVKKNTNAVSDAADLAKLAHIKGQIAYRYAVFVRLPTGPDADLRGARTVWV